MISVIGHINPDTDTTCAAIARAWYLNQTGTQATAFRTGNLNKETQFVLEHFSVPMPELLAELSEGQLIALVDTSNPDELLPGWEKASITSIVDHHKLGGLKTAEPVPVHVAPVACTTTLILEHMEQRGMVPPSEIAGIMLAAILSDTLKFTSPTTTDADTQAAKKLEAIAGVDMNSLADEMFTRKSDLTGMSASDILNIDAKVYEMGAEKMHVAVLESTKPAFALGMREELEAAMTSLKESGAVTSAMLFIVDILESNAELVVPSEHERAIAAKAFDAEFTGDTLFLPGMVSRKKQLVPALEAALR